MKKRDILLLAVITVLCFFSSLYNGFVGDDEVKILHNRYYQSLNNLPLLFKKEYIADSREYFAEQTEYFNSGEVSYRPVTSFFYFIDHALFQLKPFGYHALSLLIHVINAILVYLLLFALIKKRDMAFFAALVFALHPAKVEPVCAIAFRHELYAAAFGLGAMISYVRYAEYGRRNGALYFISLLCYFLGIFAKESVVIVPLILAAYDFYFHRRDMKNNKAAYAGFAVVLLFYTFIYAKVFPNSTAGHVPLIGGNLVTHVATSLWIFMNYALDILFPFRVNILPSWYQPSISGQFVLKAAAAVVFIIGFVWMIYKTYAERRLLSFFLLFFLIAFLPVANIFPLANPMAHRFLYFPSIGLIAWLVLVMDEIVLSPIIVKLPNIKKLLRYVYIAMCVFTAFPLTLFWESNYSIGQALVEEYPEDPRARMIVGLVYYRAGFCNEAKNMLLKCVEKNSPDPRVYYMLGICSRSDPQEAAHWFKKTLSLDPNYGLASVALNETISRDTNKP